MRVTIKYLLAVRAVGPFEIQSVFYVIRIDFLYIKFFPDSLIVDPRRITELVLARLKGVVTKAVSINLEQTFSILKTFVVEQKVTFLMFDDEASLVVLVNVTIHALLNTFSTYVYKKAHI